MRIQYSNPKNYDLLVRGEVKAALLDDTPADSDAETLQRCIEAVDRVSPARADKSAKKEKVLKTIMNCILKSNPGTGSPVLCEECPYYEFLYADDNEDDCLTRLMRDAVEIMEGE